MRPRVPRDDAALAAALLLVSVLQVLWFLPIGSRAVGLVVAVASTAPVAWRRFRPVAAALVGTLPWVVPADGFLLVGYVAVLFLYYSLTAHAHNLRAAGAVLALGLAATAVASLEQDVGPGEWAGGMLAVVAPAGVGLLVRALRARTRRLEELSAYLERERDGRARTAVAEERARIARELHDIVSHAVSVIAVQSDAAQAALEHDPARAEAPLGTIRSSAREALTEMRRLLGALREPDGSELREPLPGLAQLPALVERFQRVRLEVDGALEGLPQSLDLAAYRIVQEALTNAAKHAPGADVAVSLRRRAHALELHVADDGPRPRGEPAPDAHGLVGMRERARLHGGTFAAGARAAGGFEVQVVLPLVEP